MGNVGKALGTLAVWAGVAGLSYTFATFGVFDSTGAGWMVIGAFVTSWVIWAH